VAEGREVTRLRDPVLVLGWLALAAFLGLFVVYPLVRVGLTPTAADWGRVLESERWRGAFFHSLLMMGLSTVSSLVLGFVFAYAVTRASLPGGRLFAMVPLAHLLTPPFVGGLAFLLLMGRRGWITNQWLGLDFSIYGWHGLWMAQTLSFFPLAFLILKNTLETIDPTLEAVAHGLGARRLKVFCTVTLPLCRPGLTSAGLFIALGVLGDFGNPLLLGGRFRVLATEVYTQLGGWVDPGTAAALGLALLGPALVLFAVQQVLERGRSRFETVGSRGSRLDVRPPSVGVRVALFGVCGLVSAFIVLQYATILVGALSKVWGVNSAWTWDHFASVGQYTKDLGNTLGFAALGAVVCTVLATFGAFAVLRARVPLGRCFDLATLVPAAVPGSLLGLALVIAFHGPPFGWTGTWFIVVAAIAVKSLPEGYRMAAAALAPLKPSLDDGARNLGAHRSRTLVDVLLPLIQSSVVAIFLFSFIQGVGTLSSVIFLVSFTTPLTSVTILNLVDQGDWAGAAALASVLVAITFAALGLFRIVTGKALARELP